MKTKTINLYSFAELSEKAKEKAICDHIDFEIGLINPMASEGNESPYQEFADEMNRMSTPWFLGQYIYEKAKNDIIETIKANEYLFLESGELIPSDWYPQPEPVKPTLLERLQNWFKSLNAQTILVTVGLWAFATAALVWSVYSQTIKR